jgi:hypothetical protein
MRIDMDDDTIFSSALPVSAVVDVHVETLVVDLAGDARSARPLAYGRFPEASLSSTSSCPLSRSVSLSWAPSSSLSSLRLVALTFSSSPSPSFGRPALSSSRSCELFRRTA